MTETLMSEKGLTRSNLGPFQFFILVLSIYVLVELCAELMLPLSRDIKQLLHMSDDVICLFFLVDFVIRFRAARNKWKFMRWGWIDLLSSIPLTQFFLYGRIFRVFQVLRVMRSTRVILYFLFRNKIKGTFSLVSSVSVILIIFGAIAILQLEKGVPGANINNSIDALWWAFVTITTVGYGDYYPVTVEGRVIAAILMTAGVGLFGTFTGFIASWFLEDDRVKVENHVATNLKIEIDDLKKNVAELKELIEKQNSQLPK